MIQQFHLLYLHCQKYLHKETKIYAEDVKAPLVVIRKKKLLTA